MKRLYYTGILVILMIFLSILPGVIYRIFFSSKSTIPSQIDSSDYADFPKV